METAVFAVFAVGALAGSFGVVLSRKPVHAALSLVLTLISMAVFFVLQGAHFLAAAQVIVYAGAIVILFLFVLMLLGIDERDNLADEPLRGQRPVALVAGAALVAGLMLLAGALEPTGAVSLRDPLLVPAPNVEVVARSLFTDFLWPFEITSILLVIAVVGAVVLARRSVAPRAPRAAAGDPPEDAGAGGAPGYDEVGP